MQIKLLGISECNATSKNFKNKATKMKIYAHSFFFVPPLGISANFNGFLYIIDFILFQNKNKNHHISIVLYGMDNVSTAVYCMLVLL